VNRKAPDVGAEVVPDRERGDDRPVADDRGRGDDGPVDRAVEQGQLDPLALADDLAAERPGVREVAADERGAVGARGVEAVDDGADSLAGGRFRRLLGRT
jgi:hypothetical protein